MKTFAFALDENQTNPGCPNNDHNAIFKHAQENIIAYPRRKKNLHWSMSGEILLHIRRCKQCRFRFKRGVDNRVKFVRNAVAGFW